MSVLKSVIVHMYVTHLVVFLVGFFCRIFGVFWEKVKCVFFVLLNIDNNRWRTNQSIANIFDY